MTPRDALLGRMQDAASWAAAIVDALRAKRVGGSTASLALMYAAARVCRLRGITRENFTNVSGLMWDLSADNEERPAEKNAEPG